MSKITSEELRDLIEAATPGPWRAQGEGYDGEDIEVLPDHAPPPEGQMWAEIARATGDFGDADDDGVSVGTVANANLIALAPELAAELLALRERNAQLLNYCSATVLMCSGVATILQGAGFEGLGGAVAECVETSEFMRLAAENKEDLSVWQDEISKRDDKLLSLREKYERQQEIAGKLAAALRASVTISDIVAEAADIEMEETFFRATIQPGGKEVARRTWAEVQAAGRVTLSEWEAGNG